MALYSNSHYAIHKDLVLGYLAMFLACLAKFCSYIGSLFFRACLSVLPVHPKGGGPGGAKVVTSYAGMVTGYAGSLRYDGAP